MMVCRRAICLMINLLQNNTNVKNGLNVKELAKQTPPLKTLMQKILVEL